MRLYFLLTLAIFFFTLETLVSAAENESGGMLSGRVYTDHYFPTLSSPQYPNGVLQNSISVWLDYQNKFSPKFSTQATLQTDFFLKSLTEQNHATTQIKLREGYFSYHNDSIDLRIGQQIIPWGKSDGVNPTDYFTAKDYTTLNPDEEVRRTGAPASFLSFTPEDGTSPFTFSAIFQAVYPQTKLIIPSNAVPAGLNIQLYPQVPTAFQSKTIEFGGKFSYLKNNFDISISAYRGVNHFSQYLYDISTNRVNATNFTQSAVGADTSFTTGEFVIRAETAYFMPEQGDINTTYYGLVQPPHWETVAGIEHSFFENIQVQAQILYRHHFNFLDPNTLSSTSPIVTQIQRAVAKSNALLLNFQRKQNMGATLRIGFLNESNPWAADLFLIGYFSQGQDFLLKPQVTYKLMEGLRLLAGADLYGGEEARPLGALKKNSSVFFEARYLF